MPQGTNYVYIVLIIVDVVDKVLMDGLEPESMNN